MMKNILSMLFLGAIAGLGELAAQEESSFYFFPDDSTLRFGDSQGKRISFRIQYDRMESFKGLPSMVDVSIYKVYPEKLLGMYLTPRFHFYRFSVDEHVKSEINSAISDMVANNLNVAEAKFMVLNFDGKNGSLALYTLKMDILRDKQRLWKERILKVSTHIEYIPLSEEIIQYFVQSGFKTKEATEEEIAAKEQIYRDLIFIYQETIPEKSESKGDK